MNHGIIFTGMDSESTLSRAAGSYRLRTWLSKHDYKIEIIDYFNQFSKREIKKLCKKYIGKETLFVGISATFFYGTDYINFLFSHIKKNYPNVKTVIGGTESELVGLNSKKVDKFFWGYAEDAFLHYLDFLSGKRSDDLNWVPYKDSVAINAEQGFQNDSSDLTVEWLPEDLLNTNNLPIEISRGCIFRCRFCQYPLLGKKKNDYIRHESNLADELRRNYETYGITNYSFSDDTFNDNIVKLEQVANAIVQSGVNITYSCFLRADLLASYPDMIPILGDTGLVAAQFGLESFNETAKKVVGKGMDTQKQLAAIKKLKDYKPTWTFTGMIIGLPGESIENILESQKWFIEQKNTYFNDWGWYPLGIKKNAMTRKSEFDINYEKWGYTILDDSYHCTDWKNEFMSSEEARKLSHKLNLETMIIKKSKRLFGTVGLWHASELVGLGLKIEDIINDNIPPNILKDIQEKIILNSKKYKEFKLQGTEEDGTLTIFFDKIRKFF